jgi:pyridoxine 5-phosphate synthase
MKRFFCDGRSVWFTETIWAAASGLATEEARIDDIRGFDEVCWFGDVWGKRATCRAVVEHCARMNMADASFPIILGPRGEVLDGMHRIGKAALAGASTITAIRLREMPPPDDRIPPGDPRYEAAHLSDGTEASTKLSVNVNKVATLRNTRASDVPSVVRCARICLEAGANGITVHPRPDERHIRPQDVADLARLVAEFPGAELNVEGNPFTAFLELAERHRPAQCTLVPDAASQTTSDHGWDLARDGQRLRPIIERLHALGSRVSLFIDANADDVTRARDLGADRVELFTGPYAHAGALAPYRADAERAEAIGVGVNAGHDLNRENLPAFLEAVPHVLEVSIGHALIADALELGLAETVRRYLSMLR